MKAIHFPDWPEALARAQLPAGLQHSFEITIRWYLSFYKRGRAEATVQSARDFIRWAAQEKQPKDWQLEQWKEALRWWFRSAQEGPPPGATPALAGKTEEVWLPPEKSSWPEWKVAFLTVLRRRKYSYRTEESCSGSSSASTLTPALWPKSCTVGDSVCWSC